jgi:vacuolar-type H+-ATPase subunit C/Vma6
LEEFLLKLSETSYGKIDVREDEKAPLALEKLFYAKFIERIQQIVKLTPTKIGDFLRAYYNMRFEIINLKRIIRGKYSNIKDQEIIDSLIPIEPYLAPDHIELAHKDTLEAVIEALRNTIYTGIREQMKSYRELEALWPLELSLNHIYASIILNSVKRLPRRARDMIHRIIEFEMDIENILIAIKQREASEASKRRIEEMFPATFTIDLETLKQLIEENDLRKAIEDIGPPYNKVLAPIYEGDIALIRTALRRNRYEIARSAKTSDEFGFNVIMAYLIYSEIEKDNLVGLAWGKTQGLSSDELLKYIVVPRK